jgi:hypothetical protein
MYFPRAIIDHAKQQPPVAIKTAVVVPLMSLAVLSAEAEPEPNSERLACGLPPFDSTECRSSGIQYFYFILMQFFRSLNLFTTRPVTKRVPDDEHDSSATARPVVVVTRRQDLHLPTK